MLITRTLMLVLLLGVPPCAQYAYGQGLQSRDDTMLTPGRSGVARVARPNGTRETTGAPLSSDTIQYVSAAGNDSNDGLSRGTAKASISSALSALPPTGGTVYISGLASAISSGISISKPVNLIFSTARISGTATGCLFTISGASGSGAGVQSVNFYGLAQHEAAGANSSPLSKITDNAGTIFCLGDKSGEGADAVSVSGLWLSSPSLTTAPVIRLDAGSRSGGVYRVNIENSSIEGGQYGIEAANTVYQLRVQGNEIFNASSDCIHFDYSAGAGDLNLVFRDNWIRGCGGNGIYGAGKVGAELWNITGGAISNLTGAEASAVNLTNAPLVRIAGVDFESLKGRGRTAAVVCRGSNAWQIVNNSFNGVYGANGAIWFQSCRRSFIGPNSYIVGQRDAPNAIILDAGSKYNVVIPGQNQNFANLISDSGAQNSVLMEGYQFTFQSQPHVTLGTTAGRATVWESIGTTKIAYIDLYGYENTTATAQTTQALPVPAKVRVGSIQTISGSCSGVTINSAGTIFALPSSMSAPQGGFCKVESY